MLTDIIIATAIIELCLWHGTGLVLFPIFLVITKKMKRRRFWTFGVLLMWPIVLPLFILYIWMKSNANGAMTDFREHIRKLGEYRY